MGITGLIPFLEKASSKVHLKDLRGSTVAVDTYCWLHKGVFCCAEKLVRGEDTDLYLQYCLKYVQLLLSYDIKPILVFDGRHLPAKALTEKRRRESRQESKKRAAELLRLGRTEEARSHMRRCVDVTHEMALRLIRECRLRNVDCIVAPYEADAQMAWFNQVGVAEYVITEDSDLTLFGARKVIFKLDLTGTGLLVESDKLYLAMGCHKEKYTFEKFRRMCILSGCDYLDSLPGIGLAKACKFLLKTEQDDMWKALKKIPQYLNMRSLTVDDDYIENFLKAEATFKHMYIFNPLKRKMERLHELQEFETEERYCSNAGSPLEDDEQAFQLALGNLNPFTLKQLDNWHPDRNIGFSQAQSKNVKRSKHKSIWQLNFEPHSLKEKDNIKPSNCALFFKNVDFISKTIDEDINESIREENNKPEEAEIFTMYKTEAEDVPNLKRRRKSSSSSNDNFTSPPPSPAVTRARHNPFAKAIDKRSQTSPAICKNNSLLKILSPKKCKEETIRQVTRVTNLKRSIFNEESVVGQVSPVEIKSRFFVANVKQVSLCRRSSKDLSDDITKIEMLSQQTQENQSSLYLSSPSPKRQIINTMIENDDSTINADSGIEVAEKDVISEMNKNTGCEYLGENELSGSPHSDQKSNNELNNNQENDEIESIVLSDNEDDVKPKIVKPLELGTFGINRGPRLGLSKSKPIAKPKNNSKSKNSTTGKSQNQTRLSMFGFKKKPTLK